MTVPAIVESVGSPTLLEALEENLWAFWRNYGGAPGAERHEEEAGLRWFASGVPAAAFNGVVQVRLPSDGVEPALARVGASAARRGVPAMWWVGPNSRPTSRRGSSGMG